MPKSTRRSKPKIKTRKSSKIKRRSVKKRSGKYRLGVQNLAGGVQDINGFIRGNIDATIADLKQYILNTQNIPVNKQRLIKTNDKGYEVLDDARKISSYVFSDDTIHMFVDNVPGTFIRKFGGSGRGDGQFSSPDGICVSNDEIYVADTGNNRVQVFDLEGNFVRKFGMGNLDGPSGICEASGEIYVSSTGQASGHGKHCVQVYDLEGNFVRKFGEKGDSDGQFYMPKGICANDDIYVADRNRVQVFDLEGNFVRKFETGVNSGGIDVSNGEVYVVKINHFIEVFDLQGRYIRKIGKWGRRDGELNSPAYICVSNSEIYVSDKGNNRVQVFNLQGKFIRKFGMGNLDGPSGICVSNGQVYVADYTGIKVFDV
uniref:Ubiquitin-like domain-containing protein n=1 Tax=viral metagenome TaxID=1070528 RepID=A0A6C0KDC3_9ZZZZ